jgi:hypothetical protein
VRDGPAHAVGHMRRVGGGEVRGVQ